MMTTPHPENLDPVRLQYERFPYPPISRFALPQRNQGKSLSYEIASRFLKTQAKPTHPNPSHENIKILVAGAGTLEGLIVAQAHPLAKEIVALDLSQKSLEILKTRTQIARLSNRVLRPFHKNRIAPIRFIQADLNQWEGESFDYIIASNILHHVEDPATLLKKLSSWLQPSGILRLVTYPKQSRIWMRQTSEFLKSQGLTQNSKNLVQKAQRAISNLPLHHPLRSCFLSQPETNTCTGIIDAFFHSLENPLSPLEWEKAAFQSSLRLIGETQTETSRSSFLEELLPQTQALSPWVKLQILDDLLELCTNPILWLQKTHKADLNLNDPQLSLEKTWPELTQSLARADLLLQKVGLRAEDAIYALKEKVGPRVSAPPHSKPLPGLSLLDYDTQSMISILRSRDAFTHSN